jgi:tRNA G37 N-methylase TrmD
MQYPDERTITTKLDEYASVGQFELLFGMIDTHSLSESLTRSTGSVILALAMLSMVRFW